MYFIRSLYYWGSGVDAIPKGVIAVNLEDTADLTSNVKEVGLDLCSLGMFDDSAYQVGATADDQDLLVKLVPHEQYGEIGVYLTSDQIVPDYQFELLKKQNGLVISEHTLSEMDCCDCCELD